MHDLKNLRQDDLVFTNWSTHLREKKETNKRKPSALNCVELSTTFTNQIQENTATSLLN